MATDDNLMKLADQMKDERKQIRREKRAAKRKPNPKAAGDPETNGHVEPDPSVAEPAEMADRRPSVVVTTNEFAVNADAEAALSSTEQFFQRSNQLVRVVRTKGDASNSKVDRGEGPPRIVEVTTANLREELTRRARFVRPSGDDELKPTHPPDWCTAAIRERGEWRGIRNLEGVVESPVLLPDGSILDKPGYHAESGLLFEPNSNFPAIPPEPGQAEARAAAERVLELVADFPFTGSEHCAAWFAGLLTLLGRFGFEGPSPLFLLDATTPGSGKSRLVDLASTIAFGRQAPRAALPHNDEETRKLITSLLLAGDRLLLLDNLTKPLGGPSLDALLTSTVWKDRVLCASKVVELPARAVLFATGNNTMVRGDMLRRCLLCRLEPTEENPDERQDFRIPNLIGHALEHRGELVRDALTVLHGFCLAGRPTPTDYEGKALPSLGSFEGWNDLIRGAVVWSVDRDPCGTRQELRAEDSDSAQLAGLLEGFEELDQANCEGDRQGWTCAEIVRLLKESEDGFPVLRGVLGEWSTTADGIPTPSKLGYRLRKFRGRWCGGRCLEAIITRQKTRAWTLRRP